MFEVDYEKLEDKGNKVLKYNEDLKSYFSDLKNIIDNLKDCLGDDEYESFKDISFEYIDSLTNITSEIEYTGKFFNKASKVYSNNNEQWGRQMKIVEVVKNGKNINR